MLRFLLLVLSFSLAADEISICYQLMDQEMFQRRVVGNTIIGLTRQSRSLYPRRRKTRSFRAGI